MKAPGDRAKRVVAAARPRFPEEDLDEIHRGLDEVLRSGRLVLGPWTRAFEARFAEHVGVAHAVAVSSCTAALQIAFRFFEIRGREVVLPTNNFPGVVSAVLYEGGIPILAEMDPATFGLDVEDALARVTPNTAGVAVTHVAGLVCPGIDRLRDACQDRGLFLVEDASQALGAAIDDRKAGSLVDAGCFSFYPTKIVTTGTGGMLTTSNPDLADFARSVRHHGQGQRKNEFLRMGNDWCLSELHAVLGLAQLKHVDENVEHRNRVAGWYRDQLAEASWVDLPVPGDRLRHAYYKLPALLAEGVDGRRFRRVLEEEYGIENGSLYDPPCHLQPVFRDSLGLPEGAYPVAESFVRRQVCPPVHSTLSRGEVDQVVAAMRAVAARICPGAGRS